LCAQGIIDLAPGQLQPNSKIFVVEALDKRLPKY